MKYICPDCGLIIEDSSISVQSGTIIEHERTHTSTKFPPKDTI